MPSYSVNRTPGGGYSVRETDAVEQGMTVAASAAGAVIGFAGAAVARRIRTANANRLDAALMQMEVAAETGDWEQTARLAQNFIRIYPKHPAGFVILGGSAAQLGNYASALGAADSAAALGAQPTDVAGIRASAYLGLERMDLALREASILVSDAEMRGIGLMFRAKALLWLGDLDLSLTTINAALEADPTSAEYRLRGDIHWARGELEKAVSDYTMSHRLAPDVAETLEKRSSVYDQLGKTEESKADHLAAAITRRARGWRATHVVSEAGIRAWSIPDPANADETNLEPRVELMILQELEVWAEVEGSNGWRGWVDKRQLVSRFP